MNRLIILLALYLLGLSLWPCADSALSLTGQSRDDISSAGAPTPGSPREHHDQCTPFCTCTCCAVTITVVPRFSHALSPPAEATVVPVATFAYTPVQWAAPLSAIWQPPKLS